jgi:histone-lysine N-methyltransferase SETMAR
MEKQRAVIEFLRFEGETGDKIHQRLIGVYGHTAYSRATVYRWVAEVDRGRSELKDLQRSGRPPIVGLSEKLEVLLLDYPFHTLRTLAEETGVAHSTVALYLQEMGLKHYMLRWIPYRLTEQQKKNRYDICGQLLSLLRKHQTMKWRHLVTGDESWFFLEYMPNGMWASSPSSVEVSEKPSIITKKFMITIFWNPHGFHVVEALKEGESFNDKYMVNVILPQLVAIYFDGEREAGQKRLCVHMDNARPHSSKLTNCFIEENGLKRIPHPPYSPDIAPTDFYLFGYVKEKLAGMIACSIEELIENILDILSNISKDELNRVFDTWIKRVEAVIDVNGDYL